MPAHRNATLSQYERTMQEFQSWLPNAISDHNASLDSFCATSLWSRRQIQRTFSHYGTTFREKITEGRMKKAAELLAHTDHTVRHVAWDVGYRQPSQFAKAFRSYWGLSPMDYRTDARQQGVAA